MLKLYILTGISAGLGAVCRFALDSFINNHKSCDFPYATWIINTLACCLAGILGALLSSHVVSAQMSFFLSTGFLGGFSTFSTAMVEVARLYEDKKYINLFILAIGMFATCTIGYLVGWFLVI